MNTICRVPTCWRDIVCHGLCPRHYQRQRAGRPLTDEQRCVECEVEFVSQRSTARYCSARCKERFRRRKVKTAVV